MISSEGEDREERPSQLDVFIDGLAALTFRPHPEQLNAVKVIVDAMEESMEDRDEEFSTHEEFSKGVAALQWHAEHTGCLSGILLSICRCSRAAADASPLKCRAFHELLVQILTELEDLNAHPILRTAIATCVVDAVPSLFFDEPIDDMKTVVKQIKASQKVLVDGAAFRPPNPDTDGHTVAMLMLHVRRTFDESLEVTSVDDEESMARLSSELNSALHAGDELQLRISVKRGIGWVTLTGLRFRHHKWIKYYKYWMALLQALEKGQAHASFQHAMHECLSHSLVTMLGNDPLNEIQTMSDKIEYLRAYVSPEWLHLSKVSFACAEHCTLE